MNLSLSFFLSTFQASQTFLSGIILPSARIYLLEFALREIGGLQLVKILFFLRFKCLYITSCLRDIIIADAYF